VAIAVIVESLRPTAGSLNRRIRIESRTDGVDNSAGAVGDSIVTWTLVAETWAGISPSSGRELEVAGALRAQMLTEFTLRYREGINEKMRVVYRGVFYNIEYMQNVDMANETLILQCSSGLKDG